MGESLWLVTYETRPRGPHSSNRWRRDNDVVKGCPGLWWADQLAGYRKHEADYREFAIAYAERGETVPLSEVVHSTELRFVGATQLTQEGFDALDGVVG